MLNGVHVVALLGEAPVL
jgi:hypothetical protein